jgi:hypothetical protein
MRKSGRFRYDNSLGSGLNRNPPTIFSDEPKFLTAQLRHSEIGYAGLP